MRVERKRGAEEARDRVRGLGSKEARSRVRVERKLGAEEERDRVRGLGSKEARSLKAS